MENTFDTIEERVKNFFGTEQDTIRPEVFVEALSHVYNRPDIEDVRITMARFWDEIACNLGTYTRTGVVKSLPETYLDHMQGKQDDHIMRALADLDVKAKGKPPINQKFFCYGLLRDMFYGDAMKPTKFTESIVDAMNSYARNFKDLPEGIIKTDDVAMRQLSSFARPTSQKPDLAKSIINSLKANRNVLTCSWKDELPNMAEYLDSIRGVLASTVNNPEYLEKAGISICTEYEILPGGFIDFSTLAEQSPIVAGRRMRTDGKYGKIYYVEDHPMYLVKVPKSREEFLQERESIILSGTDKLTIGNFAPDDADLDPDTLRQKQELRDKVKIAIDEKRSHEKCPWPLPIWDWEFEAAEQLQYDPIDGIMACRIVDVYVDDKVQKGLLMPNVRGSTIHEIQQGSGVKGMLARGTYPLFKQSYTEALGKGLTPTDLNTGNVKLRPVGFKNDMNTGLTTIIWGDPIIVDIGTWSTNRAKREYFRLSGEKYVKDTTRAKISQVVEFLKHAPIAV